MSKIPTILLLISGLFIITGFILCCILNIYETFGLVINILGMILGLFGFIGLALEAD